MANKENKSGWEDALLAAYRKTPPEDEEMAMGDESLKKTAALAFGMPQMKDDTRAQTVSAASKTIAARQRSEFLSSAVTEIKQKLAANEIDPVALGVVSKEEWEACIEPSMAEKIAKAAVAEYKEQTKHAWQPTGEVPARKLSSTFDPLTSRGGIVMSLLTPGEDSVSKTSMVPKNAASILEPDRIDKFAAAENEHDIAVASSKQRQADRDKDRKEALLKDTSEMPEQMHGSRVLPSSGATDVFAHRLGNTQISIMDTIGSGTLSREEMKDWFANNFFSKVEDKKSETKLAQEERRKAIQGDRQKDKEWEAVKGPTTAQGGIVLSLFK